jgi:uncharacterized repeat protein (TIGR02543 family)
MPLTFNGTTLTAVSFNGTNITTVIFNGTTVFSAAVTMTVTFDANGGTTPSPTSKVVTNGSTYGTLATTSRSGFTFNGWFTASSGGVQRTSSSTVTETANHTLWAQWTSTSTVQTSQPTINSMSCIDYSGAGSVSVPVRNNDALSATVQVSYTSNFASGTVQSASVSPSSIGIFEFSGYSVPPGTVTFYARAQASGKTMSTTRTRTQTITVCFGEF